MLSTYLKMQTDVVVKLLKEVPLGELRKSNFSLEYSLWLNLVEQSKERQKVLSS